MDVPEDIKEALAELMRKYQEAAPASDAGAVTTNDLAFAQVTRRIKPLKGDYFRIAKDVALKANEEENKASATILPQGTASATLAEKLARLTADVKCSNIELFLLRRKFDENDQPVVRDGVGAAGIEAFQIHHFDDQTRTQLEQHVEARGVLSVLMLWTRYGNRQAGHREVKASSRWERPPCRTRIRRMGRQGDRRVSSSPRPLSHRFDGQYMFHAYGLASITSGSRCPMPSPRLLPSCVPARRCNLQAWSDASIGAGCEATKG